VKGNPAVFGQEHGAVPGTAPVNLLGETVPIQLNVAVALAS
jgi:hypothetical protein